MTDATRRYDFTRFAQLVLEALEGANVKYMLGGAVALAAWGQGRTTEDLDVVVDLPLESMAALSRELEKRDMLMPPDIMLDLWLNPQGDLAINVMHWPSGYKLELFMLRVSDACWRTMARPSAKSGFMLPKT